MQDREKVTELIAQREYILLYAQERYQRALEGYNEARRKGVTDIDFENELSRARRKLASARAELHLATSNAARVRATGAQEVLV